ncbi:uncharacterized protein B0I36DRAFT_255149 [Microdochium trichocladiopsis]|uniref:Uncharacterized protein n=1 Tax=Microdochium trichocladiopsis TaxID=1682393 RepID=A0A9P9BLM3_9PEZI|nr:uncharacterized protein B0I36DRAFT_255149 [Microdochium trichocladiopsis]KAH7014237.1 hypothetical protein B0I36DRAFT_255149 [Microdochium trichocladiopsis]
MGDPADEFRNQWVNPRDILSLLLLVGGDIVQKAIAQLVGFRLRPFSRGRGRGISIAPVAFSFGWVAYGFTNLLAAVGDMSLMPRNEHPSILVTCSNGFVRENRSWVLGRFLRDHELKYVADRDKNDEHQTPVSVRIDIFHLEPGSDVTCDYVWWCGWATLVVQLAIAAIPWGLYGDWSAMLVTLCGTLLVLGTCMIPQWEREKWAGRKLRGDKTMCLTRGNGSAHIIVLLGSAGSWDIESAAAASDTPHRHPGTRVIAMVLALLWTFLLLSVAGLQDNTWFLVAIGALGMVQNVLAAGAPRHPSASGLHLRSFERAPTIIGRRESYVDDTDASVDLDRTNAELASLAAWASQPPLRHSSDSHKPAAASTMPPMPAWLQTMSSEDGVPSWLEAKQPSSQGKTIEEGGDVVYATGVHGALMELEKWVPTAGLAMVQVFFPGGLEYNDASIRDNVHKKFWQRAYYTAPVRKRAEARRKVEENRGRDTEPC